MMQNISKVFNRQPWNSLKSLSSLKISKRIINFTGKSIYPEIPDREPIPAHEDRY